MELQTQPHVTQSSLVSHVDNVCALEGVIAEHDIITHEIGLLRELIGKTMTTTMSSGDSGQNRDDEGEEELGGTSAEVDDDDSSIRTIVPHELERVKEEDGDAGGCGRAQDEESRAGKTEVWAWGCPTYPRTSIDVRAPQGRHLSSTGENKPSRSASSSRLSRYWAGLEIETLSRGFMGGLITPPSPRSLSSGSDRLRQRKKRCSSSRVRGKIDI